MTNSELPATLLANLADSQLAVHLWDEDKLVLRIVKDIGGETGRLTFCEVSHVNLPPRLEVANISLANSDRIRSWFFDFHRPDDHKLDAEERFYLISCSSGGSYFVVATAVEYSIDS